MIKSIFTSLSLIALIGCGSSSDGGSTVSLNLQPPDRVRLAVDTNELTAKVLIDGQPYSLERGISGSPWVGSFSLPADRSLSLSVEWFYDFILIARYEDRLDPIAEPVRLEVSEDLYLTTGIEFDEDNDGVSNLAELRSGTNPISAQNIDVVIPKLATVGQIFVNGQTGVVWDQYISREWNSSLPRIDNLMIDRNALRADGEAEFYWQAAHDGVSLFVIVYGESADIATPIRDSSVATRDDAVTLFFDGDNSKLDNYDGINDFFVTIPLLARRVPADESVTAEPVVADDGDYLFDSQRFIAVGDPADPTYVQPARNQGNASELENTEWIVGPPGQAPSISFNGFKFANGIVSQGKQVYEMKIPIANLGIQVGQPFGFEVQIDSDHNGGNSDARYGWRHPSRENNGPDQSFTMQQPSFMGTVVLEE